MMLHRYLDSYVGIGRGANYLLGLGIGEELIVYCGILFFLGSCIHYGGKCAVEFSKATNVRKRLFLFFCRANKIISRTLVGVRRRMEHPEPVLC